MAKRVIEICTPIEAAIYQRGFKDGAASRDAEIAKFVAALEHYAKEDERNAHLYPPNIAKDLLTKVRKP